MSDPGRPLRPAGHNVRHNIQRLREDRRWSYRELSERLTLAGHDIPLLELGWVEAGERRVDVDDLMAFAAVFEVRPEQLLEAPADEWSDGWPTA